MTERKITILVRGWWILALFVCAQDAVAILCDNQEGIAQLEWYETIGEAQAACEAEAPNGCLSNAGPTGPLGGTAEFWCYPLGQGSGTTNKWVGYISSSCPVGEVVNVNTGDCEPDGPGGGGGPSYACNSPEVKQVLSDDAPVEPDAHYATQQLTSAEIHAGIINRTAQVETRCINLAPWTDSSGEEDLECRYEIWSTFELTDDLNIRAYQYITNIAETEISTDISCDTIQTENQSWDLSDYASSETTTETDAQGETVTEFNCWTQRYYSDLSGVTEVCDICQTVVDGVVSNTTEQCYNEVGDTTNAQDGESGTGQVDGSGDFIAGSGSPGSNQGTEGTGTNPESGGSSNPGSTGDNADLIAALDRLTDAIEDEEGSGPCDPEQPDYAECAGFVSDAEPGTQDGLTTVTDIDQIGSDVYTRLGNVPLVLAVDNVADVFNVGPQACPSPSFSLYGETFTIDMHCTILQQFTGTLSAIMLILYSVLGIRHVMSA